MMQHASIYFANRVQFIRENTHTDQWHYVPTKDNPADHASRGMTVDKLISSNWFTGPEFLKTSLTHSAVKAELMVGDPELKSKMVGEHITAQVGCTSMKDQADDLLDRLAKCTNWNVVLNIVARILRLSKKVRGDRRITGKRDRRQRFTF